MSPFSSIKEIASISRADFEKICIAYTGNAYMGDNVQLCKVLSKYKIYVDTRDIGISPHLIVDGFWESWITKWMAKLVKPGDTCLDIGANFGYYSLLLSELCTNGKVISIEPNPRICELLRKTAIVNQWGFEVVEVALSDRIGETTLTVEDKYFGGGTIMNIGENLPGRSRVTVRTLTLDALLEERQVTKVDFIKMDCEGYEPNIFAGMKKTIQANPHLKIVMEYSPYMYEKPQEFLEYLFSQFEIYKINGHSEIDRMTVKDTAHLIQFKAPVDLYLKIRN